MVNETWLADGKRVRDFSLYTGALGTAFLLFKAYQITEQKNDLSLCSDFIRFYDSASQGSGMLTFLSVSFECENFLCRFLITRW